MLSVKDDYGDHGLVALVGTLNSKNKFMIDLFAMSCRVLGRYLENWILNKIRLKAKSKKHGFIYTNFIKGPRNSIFQQFLLDNNFIKENQKNTISTFKMNTSNKINYLEIYE